MASSTKHPDQSQKEILFSEFFKQNYHHVLLIAFRFMKDEMIAQDVAQEVFLSIWEKRDLLVFSPALRPYLFKSVKNKCLQYISLRHSNISVDHIKEPVETGDSTEEDERLIQIAQEINKLPPKCKEVFHLVIFKKMKYQQAADFLHVSINTIKTQMRIAYKMLQNIR